MMKTMLCTNGNQIFSFTLRYRPKVSANLGLVSDLNQNSSFGRTLHLPLHTTQGSRGLEIGNPGGGERFIAVIFFYGFLCVRQVQV